MEASRAIAEAHAITAAKRDEFDEMASKLMRRGREVLPDAYRPLCSTIASLLRTVAREARDAETRECALHFDTLADAEDQAANGYDNYTDRFGRRHPAPASARQCRDSATANRERATAIRARIVRRAAAQPEARPLQPPLHGGFYYNPGETQ